MKYIFCAGAPGSKWSSLIKNIYYSPSVDRTDYTEARTYWHDAPGQLELMHLGAYFDPGMEFGDFFDQLDQYMIWLILGIVLMARLAEVFVYNLPYYIRNEFQYRNRLWLRFLF